MAQAQEHERRLHAQDERRATLSERLNEMERLTRLSASASSASENGPIPYEQRQRAVLGCLGWDLFPEDLMRNASDALMRAGVPPQSCSRMAPFVPAQGRGSGAEIWLLSPQAFQQARVAVRSSRISFIPNKYVWLDAKRERSETAPARIVHRLHEALAEALQARVVERGQRLPRIGKDVPGRSLRAEVQRVAHVAQLRVKWTAAGLALFTPDERGAAASLAEAL